MSAVTASLISTLAHVGGLVSRALKRQWTPSASECCDACRSITREGAWEIKARIWINGVKQ